ncbi:hypothetical protein E6P09_02245 [Haloferax mediterranei ATCC 33500]|uniref:Uncharacterized protein n=1 Tax=Haloferax mediterranei (strain ATCC 33500 / DSM 1411 / JCM 8866 / NBRC 14739 / NCIMB 2177 / R-4) TaxID=523841 RepID=I3R5S5_HALMT|nr:DUF5806 family protein [Haloferax mediterranei]AFK19585.1 hypothetical protein HFX_1888 [Haloferax mediterranei ATCC 33500]AHZ22977.1 hypothetical protein BM92_10165 [Haloferax mediterranei ATCC 33500]ELZ99905.1 hypothetical protein C439_11238 [Haloferax mediterranei ATCC 33500]MDX5987674.1 DUF5806 family protein [Haloferax mediterranei ATCC 33500]QCQ74158.1 hypothetical protein E6P09_02245 [Haloferax mediterranei ATCC 33500]
MTDESDDFEAGAADTEADEHERGGDRDHASDEGRSHTGDEDRNRTGDEDRSRTSDEGRDHAGDDTESSPEADPDGDAARAATTGESGVEEAADDSETVDDDEAAGDDSETTTDTGAASTAAADVPEDVQKYARFKKVDGAQYDRVNDFLRERTYVTAREWAIARLCADFRTETGVEMTKIGENLPELVPFMTDTYTPQAVNQARSAFRDKVRKSGATFLYGAMSGFFTAEELDEMMYEVTEIAKFLLEVEGVDLSVEEELEAEERISSVMREVREASTELRQEELSNDD